MSPDLTLPAELTIYTARPTRDAWIEALASDDDAPLHADAAGVTEIDSAGLQLLLSLQRTLAINGRTLTLDGLSDALRGACTRAGLDHVLLQGAPA